MRELDNMVNEIHCSACKQALQEFTFSSFQLVADQVAYFTVEARTHYFLFILLPTEIFDTLLEGAKDDLIFFWAYSSATRAWFSSIFQLITYLNPYLS